jgi:hypothetical protein
VVHYYLNGLDEGLVDRVAMQRYAAVYGTLLGGTEEEEAAAAAGAAAAAAGGGGGGGGGGAEQPVELASELKLWEAACAADRRAASLIEFGSSDGVDALAAVNRLIAEKRAVFEPLLLGEGGGGGGRVGDDGEGIRSEMLMDEAELTVAVVLGDGALLRFFWACSGSGSGWSDRTALTDRHV